MSEQPTKIETELQFDDTPTGMASRWSVEMAAAAENQKKYLESGEKVVKRFLDNRSEMQGEGQTRVNLFSSNVQTLQALLYGKEPKVDVKRKFADPNDDIARIGGEAFGRPGGLKRDRGGQQEDGNPYRFFHGVRGSFLRFGRNLPPMNIQVNSSRARRFDSGGHIREKIRCFLSFSPLPGAIV